jgi:hypothetical protein
MLMNVNVPWNGLGGSSAELSPHFYTFYPAMAVDVGAFPFPGFLAQRDVNQTWLRQDLKGPLISGASSNTKSRLYWVHHDS